MKNYYKILGLNFNATQKEISHAYKTLVKRYHPDINKEENAAEIFKEITESYQILKNPLRKKDYDEKFKNYILKTYKTTYTYNANHNKNNSNNSNYYYQTNYYKTNFTTNNTYNNSNHNTTKNNNTSSNNSSQKKQKSKPIYSLLKLPLKVIKIMINTIKKCFKRKEKYFYYYNIDITPLEAIFGTKKNLEIEKSNMNILIPPASYNGKVLSFYYDKKKKPIIVCINVIENDYLSFEKRGIILNIPISIKEAVLGGPIKIPTPKGIVQVELPQGTSSRTLIKLKDFDMILPNKERIALFFRMIIEPPKKFNNESFRKAINEIDKYFNYKKRDSNIKNMYNVA